MNAIIPSAAIALLLAANAAASCGCSPGPTPCEEETLASATEAAGAIEEESFSIVADGGPTAGHMLVLWLLLWPVVLILRSVVRPDPLALLELTRMLPDRPAEELPLAA